MEIGQILGFWSVALMLTMTPGADWAVVINSSTKRSVAMPTIAGLASGYIAVVLAVSIGLASLLAANPIIFNVMAYAGAGYLAWLGSNAIFKSGPAISVENANASSVNRHFFKGFSLSTLNPMALLLLLVLLPQFTSKTGSWPMVYQLLLLGSLFVICVVFVYSAIALGAGKMINSKPRLGNLVQRLSGLVMIGLAIWLIAGHLISLF